MKYENNHGLKTLRCFNENFTIICKIEGFFDFFVKLSSFIDVPYFLVMFTVMNKLVSFLLEYKKLVSSANIQVIYVKTYQTQQRSQNRTMGTQLHISPSQIVFSRYY